MIQKPEFGTDSGLSTAFGGLMTGMLGVGIGEVVIPQLVKKNGVPLPVAAGTSVLVVFLNAVGETAKAAVREALFWAFAFSGSGGLLKWLLSVFARLFVVSRYAS